MSTTKKRRMIIRRKKKEELEDIVYDDPSLSDAIEAIELDANIKVNGRLAEAVEETVRERLRTVQRGKRHTGKHTGQVRYDMWPMTAPGMPLPGPDIMGLAAATEDQSTIAGKGKDAYLYHADEVLTELYRDMLYSSGRVHIPITVKGKQQKRMAVITGHRWGSNEVTGPIKSEVMVIGKMLGDEEKIQGRQFCGPTGELLEDSCFVLGIEDCMKWYMTNLLKTTHPLGKDGSTLTSGWVREWLPILHQELRIVQPKYILCLGADALKAMVGKKATIKGMMGRVEEFRYPISREPGPNGEVVYHTALLMACHHPAHVLRQMDQIDVFENSLARFGQLTHGLRPDKEEEDLDHREIDSLEGLKALYSEINKNCERNLVAIDAEWHGEHPQNDNAYIRSIQISWGFKKAAYIHLTHPGGKWRFDGSKKALCHWFQKICDGRRLAGHFLVADLEWLDHLGMKKLKKWFRVAKEWDAMMDRHHLQKSGGFDTGMAFHSIQETADLSLTALTLRYTTAPRYDVELTKWRDRYCNEHKLKKEELEGYGECPDEVLVPYGCYDADVTWRLVLKAERLLDKDAYGNNCWEPFWMSMRALPAVLEMNCTGVQIDRDRLDMLTEKYMTARAELEQKIRDWARWPDLNLNSVYQVREFLYGEFLNGKEKEDPNDPPIRLRPKKGEIRVVVIDGEKKKVRVKADGRSLRLEPIITTDKRPIPWEEVVSRQLTGEKTPSTNKMALAILARESQAVPRWNPKLKKTVEHDFSEQVNWIRDHRFIGQVLKSVLRDPKTDDLDEEFLLDDDGYYTYPGGLPSAICDDGRVRTHIYPTKETGRWSSSRPPLQNLSKKREADYLRILGANYLYPLRTVIKAPPGHLLVEADYTGAELYGMAIMAGDKRMIADYKSGADIHSQISVLAFNLPCEPSKGGLKSLPNPKNPSDPDGCLFLRIVAKSVIFGIAYGRGAKAIALAAKEEGINITVQEAQAVIDTIFQMYPDLVPFFDECKRRALQERWLCGCFGRFRRFPVARDRMAEGDFERQAMNFPIQGMIADAVARAVDHLYEYRFEHPDVSYKLSLQIHDAVLLQVPYAHVPRVINEVLPVCMVDRVPIYPTSLAGVPNGEGPYLLSIDVEPYEWWGEHMLPDQLLKRDLEPQLAGWKLAEAEGCYKHAEFKNQGWFGDASGGVLRDLAA